MLSVDYRLFDLINGLAGRLAWLDALGRMASVFGPLLVVLLCLGCAWWPKWSPGARRQFIRAVAWSALICGACLALEWVIGQYLLHGDFRSRPYNARWTTLLIITNTHLAFPAWPVVISFALAWPLRHRAKAVGATALGIAGLIGMAYVFVGANFPLDVVTGVLLGSAIGYAASVWSQGYAGDRRMRRTAFVLGGLLLVGAVTLAGTLKPSRSDESMGNAPDAVTPADIQPPAILVSSLRRVLSPADYHLQAATNGHLVAVNAQVLLPAQRQITLSQVEAYARYTVNTLFTDWPQAGVITVEVAASLQGKQETLYTATVYRAQWPQGGFATSQPLPGKKYYAARFYAHTAHP